MIPEQAAVLRDVRAILFDLDDTLIEEATVVEEAFLATASAAAVHGVDPEGLRASVRRRAFEAWTAHPLHRYAKRIGISSWEALWARFDGDEPEIRAFASWAPGYRQDAWRGGLEDSGLDDPRLAAALADRFGVERRARHRPFPDSEATLRRLRECGSFRLGLVTNGLSCLQREKIEGSRLGSWFDAITVAGDVGRAKPDPLPFERTLRALGVEAGQTIMVGNNPAKDVVGANRAGIRAILIERHGPETEAGDIVLRLGGLSALPAHLGLT